MNATRAAMAIEADVQVSPVALCQIWTNLIGTNYCRGAWSGTTVCDSPVAFDEGGLSSSPELRPLLSIALPAAHTIAPQTLA